MYKSKKVKLISELKFFCFSFSGPWIDTYIIYELVAIYSLFCLSIRPTCSCVDMLVCCIHNYYNTNAIES